MSNPFFLHTNLMLAASSITVTSAATGFEKEKCYDNRTGTSWKANAAGTVYVTVDMGTAVSVNAWGMYAQNLFENSGTIKFQYSTDNFGADINDFGSLVTPTDNRPVMKTGATVSKRYFRWEISSTGLASAIGALSFGTYLEFERGLNIGFEPLALAQQYVPYDSETDAGEFVGRSLKKKPIKGKLSFEPTLTESFMRSDWLTLLRAIEQYPFFVIPQPTDYPNEVYFARTAGPVPNPSYSYSQYLKGEIPLVARVS